MHMSRLKLRWHHFKMSLVGDSQQVLEIPPIERDYKRVSNLRSGKQV